MSEPCRAVPAAPAVQHSPVCWHPWDRMGTWAEGWRSRGHLPLMQDRLSSGHRAGLPAPLAAPWAGHLLGTEAAAQGDTEGEDCSAEPGVLSIGFARFQNES